MDAVTRRGLLFAFAKGRANATLVTTLGGHAPDALAALTTLNDAGHLVGVVDGITALYRRSRRGRYYHTSLGVLPGAVRSNPSDINNAGQIIGVSSSGSGGHPGGIPMSAWRPFITQSDANGGYAPLRDLNTLIINPGDHVVREPQAISDAGIIIATTQRTSDNQLDSVLLLPSKSQPLQPSVTPSAPPAAPASPLTPSVMPRGASVFSTLPITALSVPASRHTLW